MANYGTTGAAHHSDENMDDDNDSKDDTKRKSRNLSEKKRRDQFNMLVNELGSMVSTNTRKMDKSTVLKSTLLFLKNHNEIAVRSRVHEIQEDWKPSFLSNEEFTHLILEALDGFIIVFSSNGRIYYASESVTPLLGYLPSELANSTIYEITFQDDQSLLYNVLLNPSSNRGDQSGKSDNQVSFTCHIKRGNLDFREETVYERVHFVGYFRSDTDIETLIPSSRYSNNIANDTKVVFVGTGRLHTPKLIRDVSLIDVTKSEFISKHSLEWKFLFLDQRASPIIGYLPFEVLGTSGYDYYHVDDLDKVVTCHESLMRKGEGTSCHYRFLTKGQQWIWLQTRFYIDYNQWNSKPEFIVCTHNVVNYTEVIKQLKKNREEAMSCQNQDPNVNMDLKQPAAMCQTPRSTTWSPKSNKTSRSTAGRHMYGAGSDTTISVGSQSSQISASTQSSKPKPPSVSSKPLQQVEPLRVRRPIDAGCLNYVEPQRYSGEPILSVVSGTGFLAPAEPTVALTVPSTMLVNQPSIVMTTAQNQIQDELQRKHEELQQLIVHQQEELRRVSEQLFIARYGILSPLMNVGVPYAVNPCQSRCDTSPNGDASHMQSSEVVQGIAPVTLPVTVPVPIVPVETFPHTSAVIPVTPVVASTIPATSVNPGISYMTQQRAQPHPMQRSEPQQLQHIQQQGQIHQDEQMMPFQICQQPDILYSSVNSSVNGQQRPTRN